MFFLKKRKMAKKGNIDMAQGIIMAFAGLAIGLLLFGMVMAMFNIFISKTLAMDVITELDAVNDTNASGAIIDIRDTGNSLIDWTDMAILIAVFGALFAGIGVLAYWGYNKMRG